MKFLITLHNINNLDKLNEADGYIVGTSLFSVRLTKSFSLDEINYLILYSKINNKEIYLNLNKMFYDEDFPKIDDFLNLISLNDLTGIIVSDIGLLYHLMQMNLNNKLIWQSETLTTNTFDFNYLQDFNIKGAFTAKEITLKDILKIGNNKKYELYINGHGYYNMFYSKRKLISNFQNEYDLLDLGDKYKYHLTEMQRENEKYPILEDDNGTHVFRSNVTNSFNVLNDLKEVVDYFVIDTIFKDDKYGQIMLDLYKHGYKEEVVTSLKERYSEKWDDGFFFEKTVYLKKESL
ncbi:MAG: peptidase U32 family protein [Acholeplasmataceae bacterium]